MDDKTFDFVANDAAKSTLALVDTVKGLVLRAGTDVPFNKTDTMSVDELQAEIEANATMALRHLEDAVSRLARASALFGAPQTAAESAG